MSLKKLKVYQGFFDDCEERPFAATTPSAVSSDDRNEGSLKRAAEKALCSILQDAKDLKLGSEINIGHHVSRAIGNFYREANNTALGEAGIEGLINPLHFKVAEYGFIGLTQFGREWAEMTKKLNQVLFET